jgi:cyclopropane fatty-acyl-phospholipid synthase-like methyltransferase
VINDLSTRLARPRFPRSATYDPRWMIDNWMGPNALWLLEWLWPALGLPPGARVLDLGCGKALTSIFLAREYGAHVVAADLWIKPADNWARIDAAGCAGRVMPILAEAHDLPFAEGYFDAVVSVDAYHYFGTDERYLWYLSRFVVPGGRIGIAVPALTAELADQQVPEHLQPYWEPDFWTFHSPAWWQRLWARSGVVDDVRSDLLEDGWLDWALWSEVCAEEGSEDFALEHARREAEMLRLDAGRTLGFARVVAGRSSDRGHGSPGGTDAQVGCDVEERG